MYVALAPNIFEMPIGISLFSLLGRQPKHFAPRYNIANWGICLPHACSAHVVHSIIETSLRPYNDTGIEFHIDVRDEHCSTRQRKSFAKLMAKDSYLATGM